MKCSSPKSRPRRVRGVSMSGVRLSFKIVAGCAPLMKKDRFVHWRRGCE